MILLHKLTAGDVTILLKLYQGPSSGLWTVCCAFGTSHDNVGNLVILEEKRVFLRFSGRAEVGVNIKKLFPRL